MQMKLEKTENLIACIFFSNTSQCVLSGFCLLCYAIASLYPWLIRFALTVSEGLSIERQGEITCNTIKCRVVTGPVFCVHWRNSGSSSVAGRHYNREQSLNDEAEASLQQFKEVAARTLTVYRTPLPPCRLHFCRKKKTSTSVFCGRLIFAQEVPRQPQIGDKGS